MNRYDYLDKFFKEEKSCYFCQVALPNQAPVVKFYQCELSKQGISTGVSFGGVKRNYNPTIVSCEDLSDPSPNIVMEQETEILIEYVTCPKCKKTSITVHRPYDESVHHIYPRSVCKQFPDYIPEQIRKDYEEACLIAYLSPKASATISRRCIQGMIRAFFGIKKSSLLQEIDEVDKLCEITPNEKAALDALRNIGNIGAHPERDIELIVDVEPDEAKLMISLIEYFMEKWFIQKHNEDKMMKGIVDIAQQKKELKASHQGLTQV